MLTETDRRFTTLSSRNRTRKAAFRIAVLLRADQSPGRISSAAMQRQADWLSHPSGFLKADCAVEGS